MNRMPRNLSLAAILLFTLVITVLGCSELIQSEPNQTDQVGVPEGDTHTIYLPNDVPLHLVRIPEGTFMMGSPEEERNQFNSEGPQEQQPIDTVWPWKVWCSQNEGPQHERTINAFWMGKYAVTKAQWEAVMGTRPWEGSYYVLDHPDSPAVWVTWHNAREFIDALNQHMVQTDQEPGDVRLPSEAEWEYAARAGTTTRFYWGDDPDYTQINDYAWWEGNTRDEGNEYAHVVGQKLPNAWGLFDMAGNVWEWCEDDWHDNYEGAPTDGSAWVDSPRGSRRVQRGGCWIFPGGHCRSAYRNSLNPSFSNFICGFRVAFP